MVKYYDMEQGSEEWIKIRCGVPTASEFSKIITSIGEPSKSASGYALTLAGEKYAGKPLDAWEGNQWTERGKELEGAAVSHYEFTHDVETVGVGFAMDEALGAGCSPDRLVRDDGMLEIKSLKAERHIQAILYYQKHGRCPTDYVQQTQGQMLVCGRQWCDLVFYHEALPTLVIRQEPDRTIQMALLSAIPKLIKERDQILVAIGAHATPTQAAA